MRKRKPKPVTRRKMAKAPATKKSNRRTSSGVTNAIARMRKEGISLRKAAQEGKVSPRTVIKRAFSALRKGKSGRYVAKTSDRLIRPLMIPTPEGSTEIEVRGLKAASLLGRYWAAVHKYYETGDKSVQKFSGEFVTATDGVKYPLLTDLDVLNRLGSAGVLTFESLYGRSA